MLKLIIPRQLLSYIDDNRGSKSRPSFILACVNYIMINNINLINNEGECNDKSEGSLSRGEDINNNRV